MIHLGGGGRYLLTGSFDRNVCVWDLTNSTFNSFSRKKILSDGTWLTHWLAHATTADESNTNNGKSFILFVIRKYLCVTYLPAIMSPP